MEYARDDISLARGGWSRHVRLTGAIAGPAREVAIEPDSFAVVSTVITRQRASRLAGEQAQRHPLMPIASTTAVPITFATRVVGPRGAVGHVAQVWVSRGSSGLTHVLVRTPEVHSTTLRIVPADAIVKISPKRVLLTLDPEDVRQLPIYRADAAVAAEVQAAIAAVLADPRARRAVKIHLDNGHVLVTGEVDTREQVEYVREATAAVRGVRGITLDLAAQEDLAASVEERIRGMTNAAAGQVRVLTELGIVYLEGTVASASARTEVERAALAAAGAKVVVNNVRIEGEPYERAAGTGPLVRNR